MLSILGSTWKRGCCQTEHSYLSRPRNTATAPMTWSRSVPFCAMAVQAPILKFELTQLSLLQILPFGKHATGTTPLEHILLAFPGNNIAYGNVPLGQRLWGMYVCVAAYRSET